MFVEDGYDSRKKDARIISKENKARIGRMMYSCTCACVYVCACAMNT